MKSSTTLNNLILSSESATEEIINVKVPRGRSRRNEQFNKNAENATYYYIRAIRALGRTQVNTFQIAEALSIPLVVAARAVISLKKKGVKQLNG